MSGGLRNMSFECPKEKEKKNMKKEKKDMAAVARELFGAQGYRGRGIRTIRWHAPASEHAAEDLAYDHTYRRVDPQMTMWDNGRYGSMRPWLAQALSLLITPACQLDMPHMIVTQVIVLAQLARLFILPAVPREGINCEDVFLREEAVCLAESKRDLDVVIGANILFFNCVSASVFSITNGALVVTEKEKERHEVIPSVPGADLI
ncbi:hypothetical protein EDD15DRAFT_2483276 [Pisolithus albus]|nr:hypothetical protein EDD15DRAFT_2483276 [Pisolithus albus]